jgi:hypothetical protein
LAAATTTIAIIFFSLAQDPVKRRNLRSEIVVIDFSFYLLNLIDAFLKFFAMME